MHSIIKLTSSALCISNCVRYEMRGQDLKEANLSHLLQYTAHFQVVGCGSGTILENIGPHYSNLYCCYIQATSLNGDRASCTTFVKVPWPNH